MKKLLLCNKVFMLAGGIVLLSWVTGSAAPLPPPPPPPVPAGDVFTQLAAGGGMAVYGAWRLWKAKRAVKKMK